MPALPAPDRPSHARAQDAAALVPALPAGALLVAGWYAVGADHPVYAAVVAGTTLPLGASTGDAVARRLPESWMQVSSTERAWHRRLGVGPFARLLELVGWNRVVAGMREFDGTRAALPRLHRAVRGSLAGHGIGLLVHVVLSVVALPAGHPWGSLWILLAGLPLHLWPMLLQRSTLWRLQKLRAATRAPADDPHGRNAK